MARRDIKARLSEDNAKYKSFLFSLSSERILKIDTIAEGKHDGAVVALIEEITQRGKSVVITEV